MRALASGLPDPVHLAPLPRFILHQRAANPLASIQIASLRAKSKMPSKSPSRRTLKLLLQIVPKSPPPNPRTDAGAASRWWISSPKGRVSSRASAPSGAASSHPAVGLPVSRRTSRWVPPRPPLSVAASSALCWLPGLQQPSSKLFGSWPLLSTSCSHWRFYIFLVHGWEYWRIWSASMVHFSLFLLQIMLSFYLVRSVNDHSATDFLYVFSVHIITV
jgi:hypothetical protein